MKTSKGFVALKDKKGNEISVPKNKEQRMIKAGWRRLSDPPPQPIKPKTTGSE